MCYSDANNPDSRPIDVVVLCPLCPRNGAPLESCPLCLGSGETWQSRVEAFEDDHQHELSKLDAAIVSTTPPPEPEPAPTVEPQPAPTVEPQPAPAGEPAVCDDVADYLEPAAIGGAA